MVRADVRIWCTHRSLLQIMFNLNSGPPNLGEYFNPEDTMVRRVW